MLLTELKKVIDIDEHIGQLQQQLFSLYEERAKYVDVPPTIASGKTPKTFSIEGRTYGNDEAWLEYEYAKLAAAWSRYGISIPSPQKLKKRLQKSKYIMDALHAAAPDVAASMGLLLVPPSRLIGTPVSCDLRRSQPFINTPDFINTELARNFSVNKGWQLLIVNSAPEGLEWGSARHILDANKYNIAGYDARSLGIFEYHALTLQADGPLDSGIWTSLFKGIKPSDSLVTSVTFFNGQYRYELDDAKGIYGDERFRPAIAVKG
jgi:hypothetical protein